MAETLFGNATPSSGDAADGTTNYSLGTRFTPAVTGTITHGRWRFPATIPSATTQVQIGVYRVSDQAPLGSTSFPLAATLGAWNEVAFPSPIPVVAGVAYQVQIWTPLRYVATPTYPWPATSANLTAASANGWLAVNPGALAFASTQSGNSAAYFADVVFEPALGGHTVVLGQASEADVAMPIARSKARTLGQPVQSDVAQPIRSVKVRIIGQAAETSTAQPAGPAKRLALGQPATADTATALVRRKVRIIGQAVEQDTATALVGTGPRNAARGTPVLRSATRTARLVSTSEVRLR